MPTYDCLFLRSWRLLSPHIKQKTTWWHRPSHHKQIDLKSDTRRKKCVTILTMLEEISEGINVPIEGKSTVFDGAQDLSNQIGKHNKSMDFDRHKMTSPRKGNKSSIGKNNNENIDACGDSYATLGASFMGESFANISMSVLALDGLDFDSDLDDECDDELDYERERMVSHQITQKSRLDAIIDFEDDEDDDRKKD